LPGGEGIPIPNRLTPLELAALSNARGVEFAVVYKAGVGPSGGGGHYWLHSGVERAVQVPVGEDVRVIYHTHPGWTPYASRGDMALLQKLAKIGSPQRSSQVVLPDGTAIRFGGKWMRDGTFAP